MGSTFESDAVVAEVQVLQGVVRFQHLAHRLRPVVAEPVPRQVQLLDHHVRLHARRYGYRALVLKLQRLSVTNCVLRRRE